jgi:hypothetical protein
LGDLAIARQQMEEMREMSFLDKEAFFTKCMDVNMFSI